MTENNRQSPEPLQPNDSNNRGITRRQVLGGAVASAVLAGVGVAANQAESAPAGGRSSASAKPAKSSKNRPAHKVTAARMPTIYLPHGGGPCFFMEWTMGPRDTWARMETWLRALPSTLPSRPKALLVVSAHWEEPAPTVLTGAAPPLLFDYYGFPKHTYELKWPAKGDPALASRVQSLLTTAGIATAANSTRGFDHGVFVPLLLSYPGADVPTIQLSLRRGLDPAEHVRIGKALAPLRDEGVLILGSGMSYHNMRGFMRRDSLADSKRFDSWLNRAVTQPQPQREKTLVSWASAPAARACHPREEHLLPLMVCAGAGGSDPGKTVFTDTVMGVQVSAHRFG